MPTFSTYSPDLVIITFGDLIISGYANDTFVSVERDEDSFMKYTGALADVCRSRNLNRGGSVTFTLMSVAPINDLMSDIAIDDEDGLPAFYPLEIKDLSGTMFCHAEIAWIKKMPQIERGKESGTMEWVLDCAGIEMRPGGNTQ